MNITFRALREMVSATIGLKLPTAKALRESGSEVVANASVGADGEITVYRSGFFTYQTPTGATVYAVDRCAEYEYPGGDVIESDFFEDEAWELRLTLEGEKRLEENNNAREEKKHYSHSDDGVEREDLRDPRDALANHENHVAVEQMMACLTEKQRRVVRMYFFEGMTQQQIADLLNIRQQSVDDQIRASEKKLKKLF